MASSLSMTITLTCQNDRVNDNRWSDFEADGNIRWLGNHGKQRGRRRDPVQVEPDRV
ncbi:hypothetical protein [Rhizorhabdus wittichii]|uniref:hypothetical protein n=1 Tax=Rhizorhabdus wittichii TaxID=160791 RepID=UPI001D034147|nr:hypothetical protein [Rhizorhabdus wittichii]